MSNDILVKVGADISNFSREMSKTTQTLSNLGRDSQKSSLTLGKLAVAVGAVAVAAKGFSMVKNSFNDAFSRIDTMEQFNRVMSTMTGSTEKANSVLDQVNETVKGTAYGLDIGARAVQDFVTSNMDVDKATETFAAWGDAVAFYGDGSNETLSSVSDALAKMTAKGKVQMDTMNRLTEAGIPAMQIYADATGQSVEEVAQQMQKGQLDAEKFTDVMNEALKNGTANFEGIEGAAKDAGASWGASFDNMQAAVTRGVVNIIQKIDEMLVSNGLPDMRQMVADFGSKFEEVLNAVANAIPPIAEKIKSIKETLEPWAPLITAVVAAAASFVTIVAVVNTLQNAFMMARTAVMVFNATLLANPIALVIALVVGLAVLVYKYWDEIKEFTITTWGAITDYFSELSVKIIEIFTSLYNWLNAKTGGAFGEYVEIIQSYLMTAYEVILAIWDYIKEGFSNSLDFIKALVTLDFQGMKNAMKNQMENSRQLLSNIWQAIKNNIGAKLSEILSNLISKFSEMVSNTRNKATEILTTARQKFEEVKQAIRDKLTEAVRIVGEKIGEMPGKVIEFVGDMVLAGGDLVQGLIDGITNMGRKAIEAITGVVNGVVEKAKSLLKIKSPSRVFKEIGEFTGEGLADGMLNTRKLVERASDKLAQSTLVDLSYNTPKGVRSSLASAVSGTVDVSSSETNAILREINRKLDRHEEMIVQLDGERVGRAVTPHVNRTNALDSSLNRYF